MSKCLINMERDTVAFVATTAGISYAVSHAFERASQSLQVVRGKMNFLVKDYVYAELVGLLLLLGWTTSFLGCLIYTSENVNNVQLSIRELRLYQTDYPEHVQDTAIKFSFPHPQENVTLHSGITICLILQYYILD